MISQGVTEERNQATLRLGPEKMLVLCLHVLLGLLTDQRIDILHRDGGSVGAGPDTPSSVVSGWPDQRQPQPLANKVHPQAHLGPGQRLGWLHQSPITQLQVMKWRHWKPSQLRDLEPTTQRALEEKLRVHWSNRLISRLLPFSADIPAMAAVMGDGDNHLEFLHLLGDARFSNLRQRCLSFEKLKKQGGLLQVPWTEQTVRQMLSQLHSLECTPNYIQQAWDTLKWFSSKFQTLDVESLHRLQAKKKFIQETLVTTTSTPQRKAVVPSREVIWALEKGAAAVGAASRSKGTQAREAIDAFILGLVRFQVGCSARFNDLQHTSPVTLRGQTKTASAFRIKKNPVPLIAPKLSLSGEDWWTDWVATLQSLHSSERLDTTSRG